jgi:hypothetical protein
MPEGNMPVAANVPLSNKEGVLIDTRSITERVQGQYNFIMPQKIQKTE